MIDLLSSLPGAVAQGLIWGIMAVGVYITYKLLDIADLSVDGSICTGAAVCTMMLLSGRSLWLAVLCAVAAGEEDLFIAPRSSPWDHNAARIILCEAGGSICSLHGMPLPVGEKSAVLAACSKELEQTVLSLYFPV